jgi:U4/U6 small nuclear ribonucleoprotein PRP4
MRVWDLRRSRQMHLVPAHTKLISHLAFSPGAGEVLASASYDTTVRMWRARDAMPLHTLRGHDARVMALDWTPDTGDLVTGSWDRTIKLWTPPHL